MHARVHIYMYTPSLFHHMHTTVGIPSPQNKKELHECICTSHHMHTRVGILSPQKKKSTHADCSHADEAQAGPHIDLILDEGVGEGEGEGVAEDEGEGER